MKFRAAVLHETGKPLVIETLETSTLAPTDVLVRIHASGLCHTDLEVIQGSLPYPLPIVLGHEGAGVVEAVGEDVVSVRPGDHVVCSWNPHCGQCFYCEKDLPILCEPLGRHQPRGTPARRPLAPDARRREGASLLRRVFARGTAWCPSRARSRCLRKSRSIAPV